MTTNTKSKWILISFIIINTLFSCRNNNDINKIVNEQVGSQLNLIDSLKAFSIINGWINIPTIKCVKIITYIDGTCSQCIYELDRWSELMKEKIFTNVNFRFYIKTNNLEQTSTIMRQLNFTYPVFVDFEDMFYLSNNLPDQKICQTFLIDTENRVLLIGNPNYSFEIKELYISTIRDIMNEK